MIIVYVTGCVLLLQKCNLASGLESSHLVVRFWQGRQQVLRNNSTFVIYCHYKDSREFAVPQVFVYKNCFDLKEDTSQLHYQITS